MMTLSLLFAFILGTVLASFVNVLVVRLKDASTVWGRSQCVHCKTVLKPHHLVPIVSWLVLKGKCASCKKPIHIQYPLVELLGGILGVIAYARHPFLVAPAEFGRFAFEIVLSMDLLMLTTFDFRWKLLPVEFIAGSALVFGLWNVFAGYLSVASVLIGCAVGVGFLGAQVLVSRGKWMGSGDPWMGGLLGLALGWPGIGINLYFTYIFGGALAIVLLFSGRYKRNTRVPFGPLLAIGGLLTIWVGPLVEFWVRMVLNGG